MSWLAPATALLLLAGVFLNGHNSAVVGSPATAPMVLVALSNQSAAAYLSGSFPHEENRLPAVAFEWNVRGGATSAINAVLGPRRRR